MGTEAKGSRPTSPKQNSLTLYVDQTAYFDQVYVTRVSLLGLGRG